VVNRGSIDTTWTLSLHHWPRVIGPQARLKVFYKETSEARVSLLEILRTLKQKKTNQFCSHFMRLFILHLPESHPNYYRYWGPNASSIGPRGM